MPPEVEICTFAFANTAVFVTEVAVIVTAPTVSGGEYIVAVPLGVVVGLNVPQAFAGMAAVQLQVTPAFLESPVTVAVTETAGDPGGKKPGGGWVIVTCIPLLFELPHPARFVMPRAIRMIQRDLRFIAGLLWTRLRSRCCVPDAPAEIRGRCESHK